MLPKPIIRTTTQQCCSFVTCKQGCKLANIQIVPEKHGVFNCSSVCTKFYTIIPQILTDARTGIYVKN